MATLGASADRTVIVRRRPWSRRREATPAGETTAWLQQQTQEARGRAAMLRQYATLREAMPTVRALCDESLTNGHHNP